MDEPGKIGGQWASEAPRAASEQDAGLDIRGKTSSEPALLSPEGQERAERELEEATAMLQFESGATRNRKEDELAYSGFISPLALQMFARYMHQHRFTADGKVREPDNWQKGIPDESYVDSLLRHVIDIWLIYRGYGEAAREGKFSALSGAFFNVQGLMHNWMTEDVPTEQFVRDLVEAGMPPEVIADNLTAYQRDQVRDDDRT